MSVTEPTPAPAQGSGNTLTLVVGAAVAIVVIIALVVLIALGKASWSEVGPTIALLAGVHGGAALTAFNPSR